MAPRKRPFTTCSGRVRKSTPATRDGARCSKRLFCYRARIDGGLENRSMRCDLDNDGPLWRISVVALQRNNTRNSLETVRVVDGVAEVLRVDALSGLQSVE